MNKLTETKGSWKRDRKFFEKKKKKIEKKK